MAGEYLLSCNMSEDDHAMMIMYDLLPGQTSHTGYLEYGVPIPGQ